MNSSFESNFHVRRSTAFAIRSSHIETTPFEMRESNASGFPSEFQSIGSNQMNWTRYQNADKPMIINRNDQNQTRLQQFTGHVENQSRFAKGYQGYVEKPISVEAQQRKEITVINQRQHLIRTTPSKSDVITRQIDQRFRNAPVMKMSSHLDWMPTDLVHIQPLQETLSIEDVARYEMAMTGNFELRGHDMEALYTIAGLL